MNYRATYADDNIVILMAETDSEAFTEALEHEGEHGQLFDIDLLDDDYNWIRTVL